MANKIGDLVPEKILRNFSKRKTAVINNAIKRKMPILFTGEGAVGKTTAAHLLRKEGIAAYAPEDVLIVNLESGEVIQNG
jgi:shikimate kinase